MKTDNKFYISKSGETVEVFPGYSWATGQLEEKYDEEWEDIDNRHLSTESIPVSGYKRFRCSVGDFINSYLAEVYDYIEYSVRIKLYFFKDSPEIVEVKEYAVSAIPTSFNIDEQIPTDITSLALEFIFNDYWDFIKISSFTRRYERLREVSPHYKTLKKQFKKENDQVFFRESLDGKISLWDLDYLLIKGASIEDKLCLYLYKRDLLYSANEFNKTDCKFDHFKGSVELKLSPTDSYTNILNKYKNTYDLLKLSIAKTKVQITKRSIIQIYIKGSNTITNYASGLYWEDEVTSVVDNPDTLKESYYFSEGPTYAEVSLSGFKTPINAAYGCTNSSTWKSTCLVENEYGNKVKQTCEIRFSKVYSQDEEARISNGSVRKLGNPGAIAYTELTDPSSGTVLARFSYDTYRIEVYTGGSKVYQSSRLYGNDSNFKLVAGDNYNMTKLSGADTEDPKTFYLGKHVITYQIFGRLLCDSDMQGLYDLPADDFAVTKANFRKCIGLLFKGNGVQLVHFKQSQDTQLEPTPYGLTEYGEYFKQPFFTGAIEYRLYAYPLARSTWGNTSLWVGFEENISGVSLYSLENWLSSYYKAIELKDCLELGSVIKALLAEMDPEIKFDSTTEFSEFFYGSLNYGRNNLGVYLTQKSNVLKGEYDQAAQKAEITFEQLMNMLRDCFRCYWYVDTEKRFRIEHVRYFMQGHSYEIGTTPTLNLQTKYDKFNRKRVLYGQQEIAFSKTELNSRYEFAWSDDVSEVMGQGFVVDVHSNYVEQDKVETVNIDSFTSDIDFMMFAPDKFSQDGFALIIADRSTDIPVVPIIGDKVYSLKDANAPMILYAQNYHASFIKLFENYLSDMPAKVITTSCESSALSQSERYRVSGLKRCMLHNISFPAVTTPAVHSLVRTDSGDGVIESLSVDIDTDFVETELSYEPS